MGGSRLKVLVVSNLPPYVMGGAENQVSRLVEVWLAQGAEVEVAGHRIPTGVQELGAQRLQTHRLFAANGLGRLARGCSYLVSHILFAFRNRSRFDVVYSRGMGDAALALALLKALRIVSWKLVVVPINARGDGDAAFVRSVPFSRFWLSLLDSQIDAVNLINAAIAEDLERLGIVHPPRFSIPNGVSVAPAVCRKALADPRRLVWTGRLEKQKGIDLLLNVLASQRQAGRRFRLSLWGEGSLRGQLQQQVERLGMSDCVSFGGALPADQVRSVLEDADAFVLPSRYEGMSNAALEAMEAGLPVLCTRCGGIDTYVEDGAGWTCAPDDEAALAQAVGEMLGADEGGWLARGRRARELVEEFFSIEQVASRNLDLFRTVCR
ncbi:glycosyltransferase family 4 protein [Pseudomarimonas salicorniae]|uniref:Glycosyltransferase family 4 protein n=1 Tax=Pseudomarimonas salicorniae TaxID=2933270 RepID=A0ABT0GFL5_9GAMM|nr:glycosyltransferase family 4 protein [Lysobacter sp. CAU 1642]MCK7593331.1 glycosyltransferase family 4 protein [Lysobacter sp. CAU 1642]